MDNKLITLVTRPDPITRVSWDNYVTVSNADAKELGMSNEIVANGGLNGSYDITTKDGMKLENVPVINQVRQLVLLVLLRLWSYGSFKEEMQN
jgi:molybdopterin-containing oxidoreductase family iron-sulfur binding subunit